MNNEKNEIVTTGYEIQSAKSEPVVRKFNLKKSKPVVWKSLNQLIIVTMGYEIINSFFLGPII